MKKELREEIRNNAVKKNKKEKMRRYLTTLEALGVATLIGLTGLSGKKILKDKKLLKKIKSGKLLKSLQQRAPIKDLTKKARKAISGKKSSK